jgi:hypothetical protein
VAGTVAAGITVLSLGVRLARWCSLAPIPVASALFAIYVTRAPPERPLRSSNTARDGLSHATTGS